MRKHHEARFDAFYESAAWQACRRAYKQSVGGLCETCRERGVATPGLIVHHRQHLNEQNISDPAVTLGWPNLQLLCIDCHNDVHAGKEPLRYTFDENGNCLPG